VSYVLQWSRSLSRAEGCGGLFSLRIRGYASMEPLPFESGRPVRVASVV